MHPITFWDELQFPFPASFEAPLITSIVATKGASPIPTFAVTITGGVDGGGFVSDWEQNLKRCKPQEARFTGSRRVENLCTSSQNFSTASWTKDNYGPGSAPPIVTPNYGTDPFGGNSASRIQLNKGTNPTGAYSRIYNNSNFPTSASTGTYVMSVWFKSNTGSNYSMMTYINGGTGGYSTLSVTVTPTWTRFATTITQLDSTTTGILGLMLAMLSDGHSLSADISVFGCQIENVSNQSNQTPAEYVSCGQEVSPWHGANVDGVKYFNTMNGNTRTAYNEGYIITSGVGAKINTLNGASPWSCDRSNPLGFLPESPQDNLPYPSIQEGNFTNWGTPSMTIADKTVAGPTGEVLASSVTDTAGNAYHYINHSAIGIGGATDLYYSTFVKAGWKNKLVLRLDGGDPPGSMSSYVDAYFDLAAVTQYTQGVGGNAVWRGGGIIPYRNGWYRCWLHVGFGVAPNSGVIPWIICDANVPYDGNTSTPAMHFYGSAIQASKSTGGTQPPSYVNSKRGLDKLIYPPWGNFSQSVGTCYAEVRVRWTTAALHRPVLSFDVSSTGAIVFPSNYPNTSLLMGDGTTVIRKDGTVDASLAMQKMASSWGYGAFMSVTSGGNVPQKGTFDGVMPAVGFGIGVPGSGSTPTVGFDGNIRNLIVYGYAASDRDLMDITSGSVLLDVLEAKERVQDLMDKVQDIKDKVET